MRTLTSLGIAVLVLAATALAQNRPQNVPVGQTVPAKIIPSGGAGYSTTDLSTVSPAALAGSLVGAGVTVSNVSIISDGTNPADNVAIGAFSNGSDLGIGIDSGIVLSSGDIATAVGPNSADNLGTNNSTGADPDLQAIATATLSDSAVLQFDFTDPSIAPGQTGTVQFQFVFGSEEYNEFVDDVFNDTFAFFLNGVNIAVLPDLVTPVAINNFNCGNPFDPLQTDDFCSFFNNNDLSDGGPFFNTEMDGFSDVFTAFGTVTGPGPHTIKLAIGDAGDSGFDSWVFLQGGSLQVLTDPSCVAPTPDGQTLSALVDAETVNFPVVAASNSITPGVASSVSITGVSVLYTAPGGSPTSIPLPAGVSFDDSFPTAGGQPETINFSWSPSSASNPIGVYEFCFQLQDQAGITGECCVSVDVFECMIFLGVQPISIPLTSDPADVLRVDPLWYKPMTLNALPQWTIPNVQALHGFKFYAQGLINNENAYPGNALSMSWLIEYTIGQGATYLGPQIPSNIHIYPSGNGVVNPGDTFSIPFALVGFGGF
jgi:hypothetical protein